jgi:hypothetical protein
VCIVGCREVGSRHSRKLYYLDVTYLNINKAFPKKRFVTDTEQNVDLVDPDQIVIDD